MHKKYGDRLMRKINNDGTLGQPIGVNTIAKFPKDLAMVLNLDDLDLFTGYCHRRTATTFAAESDSVRNLKIILTCHQYLNLRILLFLFTGMTMPELKMLTGHKSGATLMRYIAGSDRVKMKVARCIMTSEVSTLASESTVSTSKNDRKRSASRE